MEDSKSVEATRLFQRVLASDAPILQGFSANNYWEDSVDAFGIESDRFVVYMSVGGEPADPSDRFTLVYLAIENRLGEKVTSDGVTPGPTVCEGYFVGEDAAYEGLIHFLEALSRASPSVYAY